MWAAVLLAEPPLPPEPGEPGEPPPGALPAPAEGETAAARGHEGGIGPLPGEVPGQPRELEEAGEPLLDPGVGGHPSAPWFGEPHCVGSAPASPSLAAQGLPAPESIWSHSLSPSCRELSEPGGEAGTAEPCCVPAEAGSGAEEECPICTEPYDSGWHQQALLNCGHALCNHCLRTIMDTAGAAEIGRVRCPICRQKTPMLEWEICKLQEELLLLHDQPTPASSLAPPLAPILPPRRPGLCGALEHHFQVRFHNSRMFGCLPCVRYPLCLVTGLGGLERRCRCCYLLSLAALLVAETCSLLLIFLPIVLLVLLFLILDK